MLNATIQFKNDSLTTMQGLVTRYREIYEDFSKQVDAHSNSIHSIPEVSKQVGDEKISAINAMKIVNSAAFDGQSLTNKYHTYYAIKLGEIYYDSKAIEIALKQTFMQDPDTEAIKTSAEKERKYDSFASDILAGLQEIKKMQDGFIHLGKYVENIVYSLDRLQRMIDSLERLASKELWVDTLANNTGLNVINEPLDKADF